VADSEPILELDRVSRLFDGGRVAALRDLSLRVARGEWLTITGPSGCGKSTLLHMMCGLDRPSSGTVRFAGARPATRREWSSIRRHRIGFVFQAFHLIATLTAQQNVMVPMFGTIASARERRRRANTLLERLGLADRALHRPSELSGGERQRVAIARALANSPELLLADEPTGNLDRGAARSIVSLLEEIRDSRREMTIVLASHDAGLAAAGDRLLEMLDGRAA